MNEFFTQRRYLLPFKVSRLPQQFTDVLVIGSGVAGLRAAIAAADHGAEVLLLTKDTVAESNTWYAQGGIAAVLQPADSTESHIHDTEISGVGLTDTSAVKMVIEEGPARVLELLQWGARFDRHEGNAHDLAFTREGGHSFARIVHAFGDATGKEVAETLIRTTKEHERVRISEKSFVIDLLTNDGRCIGALAYVNEQLTIIWAQCTILASGGAGQIYRETTNPRIATGGGHAMAYRAGAALQDMEMVQFHPTTLYVAGSSRALITEAVRGEGAYLIDRNGYRFMKDYHPSAELAPRDIVSRAIVEQIRRTNYTHVYLDVRHLPITEFRKRFPQLAILVDQFEINPAHDLIPVHPAAHYMIGGVDVDLNGRSSLDGLYAIGEVSSTGLHGANRLGSNSLLEGLAYGARAGVHAAQKAGTDQVAFPRNMEHKVTISTRTELDITDIKSSLRSVMWRNAGIERTAERLAETREIIGFWARYIMDKSFDPAAFGANAIRGWELQNMLTTSHLIVTAAYTRTESRGAHYRIDYPERDDKHWRLHLLWKRSTDTPIPAPVE